MSLAAFLTSTATVERPTGGVSSIGGKVNAPFATVTGKSAMACAIWPAGTGPSTSFAQFAIDTAHVFIFMADPGARAGDRLNVSGVYYLVNGRGSYANGAVSPGETVYVVETKLRTES